MIKSNQGPEKQHEHCVFHDSPGGGSPQESMEHHMCILFRCPETILKSMVCCWTCHFSRGLATVSRPGRHHHRNHHRRRCHRHRHRHRPPRHRHRRPRRPRRPRRRRRRRPGPSDSSRSLCFMKSYVGFSFLSAVSTSTRTHAHSTDYS